MRQHQVKHSISLQSHQPLLAELSNALVNHAVNDTKQLQKGLLEH